MMSARAVCAALSMSGVAPQSRCSKKLAHDIAVRVAHRSADRANPKVPLAPPWRLAGTRRYSGPETPGGTVSARSRTGGGAMQRKGLAVGLLTSLLGACASPTEPPADGNGPPPSCADRSEAYTDDHVFP